MSDWKEILAASLRTAEALARYLPVEVESVDQVIKRFPMRISPYYLGLIKTSGDPLWKQTVPDLKELECDGLENDPLSENIQSPVPNLIHRYPDRVVLIVSDRCAVYCRHCMRKRYIGQPGTVTAESIDQGIGYIRSRPEIRDVILSGGDPLLLSDNRLEKLLQRLRKISHVQIIRIHSRAPCTLPMRITNRLAETLSRYHPIFINTQFNHPDEITPEAAESCKRLADAGIPLGCQTVLLKGVNDDAAVMKRLMRRLLTIRVKPYYIHHADPVEGTAHLRTSIQAGLDIMRALRGYLSGPGVPYYMVDLPGGGGKIPLLPEYVEEVKEDLLIVRNFEGKLYKYRL
jgi:lysine 2,3-aminomutase